MEHIISIESIKSPKEDAEYPRISGQNKARKRYCPECKEQGRKEVATLLCMTCSNEQGTSRYLCEECAQEHLDEDHYVEEARF